MLVGVIPGFARFWQRGWPFNAARASLHVREFAWFDRARSGMMHRLPNVRQSVFQREFPNHTQHLVMN